MCRKSFVNRLTIKTNISKIVLTGVLHRQGGNPKSLFLNYGKAVDFIQKFGSLESFHIPFMVGFKYFR